MEGGAGEALGVRNHSTRGIVEDGRSGGGYVVGNEWGGVGKVESGQYFCHVISKPLGREPDYPHLSAFARRHRVWRLEEPQIQLELLEVKNVLVATTASDMRHPNCRAPQEND